LGAEFTGVPWVGLEGGLAMRIASFNMENLFQRAAVLNLPSSEASRKVLDRFRIEGLTKGIDAALGAAFGAIEAILIISAVIVLFDAYYSPDALAIAGTQAGALKDLAKAFNGSETVHLLRDSTVPFVVTILGPLLPSDLHDVLPTKVPIR